MISNSVDKQKTQVTRFVKNQRGQGLVEYLVIVALMGVATIAIVRTMGAAVSTRFASVTNALQGEKFSDTVRVDASTYRKRDLGNFFDGVEDNSSSARSRGAQYVGAE